MVRFGGISREQARIHPDRNIITRAVGVEVMICRWDLFFLVPLEGKDRVLLCSDGLIGMLEDENQCRFWKERQRGRAGAAAGARLQTTTAGRDNIAGDYGAVFQMRVRADD